MNRIAKRSWFTVVLSGMLIVGLLGILVRYTLHAEQWAAFSRSPYIYHTGGTPGGGQVLDRDGNQIELKEDEDAMDTFNLARMDAEDDRHRNNPFADEAELEDAGFEYVADDEVNADFAGDDQED